MTLIKHQLNKYGFIKMFKPDLADEDLIDIANTLGEPISSRRNGKVIDRLSPKNSENSYKNSLSRTYGLDSFPLHSDTAYFKIPVRYILLYCKNPGTGERPSYLYDASLLLNIHDDMRFKLSNTIFKVVNGRNSFLSTIYNSDSNFFRFDKNCMKSTDSEGDELLNEIDSLVQENDIKKIAWSEGDLLIIDNWRLLHGRGSSQSEDSERLLYRLSIRE